MLARSGRKDRKGTRAIQENLAPKGLRGLMALTESRVYLELTVLRGLKAFKGRRGYKGLRDRLGVF